MSSMHMASSSASAFTAGAIPVKNAKGELSMQKVKVTRYVAGKRPEYARDEDESSDEDEANADEDQRLEEAEASKQFDNDGQPVFADTNDKERLARLLKSRESSSSSEDDDDGKDIKGKDRQHEIGQQYARSNSRSSIKPAQARQIAKPEIVQNNNSPIKEQRQRVIGTAQILPAAGAGRIKRDDDDDDDDDDERGQLRRMLRRKMDAQRQEEANSKNLSSSAAGGHHHQTAVDFRNAKPPPTISFGSKPGFPPPSAVSSAQVDEDADEEDEEEEEEEEDVSRPRVKPVFVRRKDRLVNQEEQAELRREQEAKRLAEERRQEARRMVEKSVKIEIEQEREKSMRNEAARLDAAVPELPVLDSAEGNTADEDEIEYEAWRVRELSRIKRDREEREKMRQEQAELDRLRSLDDEDRDRELAGRKKIITNPNVKGKMGFLQRYYHRGVFYLDKDDKVFQRDITAPTLEDRFDKTNMPVVLQVKNFGKSGRSKWTHLVNEDTTGRDNPWTGGSGTSQQHNNTRFGSDSRPGDASNERQSGTSKRKRNE